MSTIIANVMISTRANSMDVVSFVGAPPQGCPREAKSQCKGRATFWLDNLMETGEFIRIVVANATFVVRQLTICVNVLNQLKNCVSKLAKLRKLQGGVNHANVNLAKTRDEDIDNFQVVDSPYASNDLVAEILDLDMMNVNENLHHD